MYTTRAALPELDAFMEAYHIDRMVLCPEVPNRVWKRRGERVCRFCGLGMPDTTFRSDSHWIPEFMGNRYLMFQEECDVCNAKFGTRESDFANYLGPLLTFFSVRGKGNKLPKFGRKKEDVAARQEDFYGIQAVGVEKDGGQVLKLDRATGKGEVHFVKRNYVPLAAYKCLLKIAASSLKDEDMVDYGLLMEFLLMDKWDEQLSDIAWVKEYFLPKEYVRPVVFMFRTKEMRADLPMHVCMLYFSHMAYEFVVPGNRQDAFMKGGVTITPIFAPPFFGVPVDEVDFHGRMVDLGGREVVIGEQGVFHMGVDPAHLKDLAAYDPALGKMVEKEFDPEGIVKLVIGRNGDKLNIPLADR